MGGADPDIRKNFDLGWEEMPASERAIFSASRIMKVMFDMPPLSHLLARGVTLALAIWTIWTKIFAVGRFFPRPGLEND